jgi:hypothetical protein
LKLAARRRCRITITPSTNPLSDEPLMDFDLTDEQKALQNTLVG